MNSNQTNEEKIFHVMNQLKAAGERDPEITLKEYMERYAPEDSFNNCCIACSRYASCAWSKGGNIPGMVITRRKQSGGETTGKIYYCPEFNPDTEKHRYFSDESFNYLLEAIGRQANQELQDAIISLKYFGEAVKKARAGEITLEEAAAQILTYADVQKKLCSCTFFLSNDLSMKLYRKYDYTPDPELDSYAEAMVPRCHECLLKLRRESRAEMKKQGKSGADPLPCPRPAAAQNAATSPATVYPVSPAVPPSCRCPVKNKKKKSAPSHKAVGRTNLNHIGN